MQVKVKPSKEGLLVRNPKTMKFIAPEGEIVDPNTSYWDRRLRSGDVVIVQDQPAAEVAKKK